MTHREKALIVLGFIVIWGLLAWNKQIERQMVADEIRKGCSCPAVLTPEEPDAE